MSGEANIAKSEVAIQVISTTLTEGDSYTLSFDATSNLDTTAQWLNVNTSTGLITILSTIIDDAQTTTGIFSVDTTVPAGANAISIGQTSNTSTILVLDNVVLEGESTITYDVNIDTSATDLDGSEVLQSVTLSGIPTGATLSNGATITNNTATILQSELSGLKITVPSDYASMTLVAEVTTLDTNPDNASNTDTSSVATATITVTSTNALPSIGDATLNVTNDQQTNTTNIGSTIDTQYGDGTNYFSWNPAGSNVPALYVEGQKVAITYDNSGTVTGTITGVGGATVQVFQTTVNMADADATTYDYSQFKDLLGVQVNITGEIILPGGGNNDAVVLQFGGGTAGVDALVTAHNLIEDTPTQIADATAEHTVNTNNYYIGVDSNNMNAGQQLVFDFITAGVDDGNGGVSNNNEVTYMNIKLFNFGSEKSGDELFITIITVDPDNPGNTLRENILLTQDSDYTSELEYTVQSNSGNPMVGVEFLAGNESSFKLGIEGVGAVDYQGTFDMTFAYDITDSDGDTDPGAVTINIDSGEGHTYTSSELTTTEDSSIIYDANDYILNAGLGTDTLVFTGGDDISFHATDAIDSIKNIEVIDLASDAAANALTGLKLSDVIAMTDSDNELIIKAGGTDSVLFAAGDGWEKSVNQEVINGDNYDVYTNTNDSSVTVKIDENHGSIAV